MDILQYFFVTDLHGSKDKFKKLFNVIRNEKPQALFIGGDILPHRFTSFKGEGDFIHDFIMSNFLKLKSEMKYEYPEIFLILGNDDLKAEEIHFINAEDEGIFSYIHNKKKKIDKYTIYGYANVPPTPFKLKDWERYDVSRYVEPGCIPPEEGIFSLETEREKVKYTTIKEELEVLAGNDDLSYAIFLFHTPPYKTNLDRAALDGIKIDHAELDPHVGSIAVRRFIEERTPLITLHGHIHESARITGKWRDKIGNCYCFSAAHDGNELALVKFNPLTPEKAKRILI